jgi:hypothetical protein
MASPVLTEGQRTGEFIVREANGYRSRDVFSFINSGTVTLDLPAGTVVSTVTADSTKAPYTNAGTLGLAVASGILFDNLHIPASGTVSATVIVRDAEVNASELKYASGASGGDKTAALVDLKALGIIGR